MKRVWSVILTLWIAGLICAILYLILPLEWVPFEIRYKGIATVIEENADFHEEKSIVKKAKSVSDLQLVNPFALNTSILKKRLNKSNEIMTEFAVITASEFKTLSSKFNASFYLATDCRNFDEKGVVKVASISYDKEKNLSYVDCSNGASPSKYFYSEDDAWQFRQRVGKRLLDW